MLVYLLKNGVVQLCDLWSFGGSQFRMGPQSCTERRTSSHLIHVLLVLFGSPIPEFAILENVRMFFRLRCTVRHMGNIARRVGPKSNAQACTHEKLLGQQSLAKHQMKLP